MPLPVIARIRQVARSGDTLRAWQIFADEGLEHSPDPDVLALKGRLLKDRARRLSGEAQRTMARAAAEAYRRSAGAPAATYPLINAATISYLCGDRDQARAEARRILSMIESGDHEPETPYWLYATAAEALLLLGDREGCRAALKKGLAAVPAAWEDQAATTRQLREILLASGEPLDLLEGFHPPASLHFSGLMELENEGAVRGQLAEVFDTVQPGAVYGALAAGADIIAAELALERGAQLHVTLPATIEEFLEISVEPFGDSWGARFRELLDAAHSIIELAEHPGLTQAGVHQASEVAMGLAIRSARALASEAVAVDVVRQGAPDSRLRSLWEAQGLAYRALVQDWPRRTGDILPEARTKTVLAARNRFASQPDTAEAMVETGDGHWLLVFDATCDAVRYAGAHLLDYPGSRLGIDACVVLPGGRPEHYGQRAVCLSRAAQGTDVCGPWPQMVAMDLIAPELRFEVSGELVTPFGDIPLARYTPLAIG
ncbi:TRAFs-binding domain-containing protein [Novosphingobium sp. 1949]|uniref:TRAFs-binding domain-containing protein n=1 Tax=Novosphingobium organovorum TaxID=2930092 RepID=A0ABT0BA06_9SPHN|nr:TRAFs-binding domain-containing protein [Novosphingobium organovorum]MCJ2181915.1 TRAFs-binding domain-containing protein [Novosphingobium organovorum]